MKTIELVIPDENCVPGYLDALRRGWSPDNIRSAEAAAEELADIEQDSAQFIAQRADDREAQGGPVQMPDGSTVQGCPVSTARGRGYATKALALMLNEARAEGLPYIQLIADPENLASQKTILPMAP